MILEKNETFTVTEAMIPPQMSVTIDDAREAVRIFADLRMRYQGAIKEISTKLEVLDNEFSVKHDYNPIHHMTSRIKSVDSIFEKIKRKGWPMEMESVYKVMDFAGVRVICNYLEDIYRVEDSLLRQDYIKNPKESGYRSLHLVIEVPIFLSDRTYHMPVEIQIRTVAMDTWASLEHELKYKRMEEMPEHVAQELKDCAKMMAELDDTMQSIHKML